jgi:predicted Kef-type K+ transport protein
MFHGILSQTWLLADEGVTISSTINSHGQKVILLGMILSVTSAVILVLGLLTLSINKKQVLFPQAKQTSS